MAVRMLVLRRCINAHIVMRFLAQPFASRRARPQNPHTRTFKAMSFLQELSQATAQAQRAYELETERLVQPLVATHKEKFTEECRKAAQNQQKECCIHVYLSDEVKKRDGGINFTEQKLRAMLLELGVHDGRVEWREVVHPLELQFPDGSMVHGMSVCTERFEVSATCPVTSSKQPSPEPAGGTCITCPICHEHRPAVVLIPCGHVVCRDCQRCLPPTWIYRLLWPRWRGGQQLRQCPKCCGPISSASNALFMD